MNSSEKAYIISELDICVNSPWQEMISAEFKEFTCDKTEDSYQVIFEEKDKLQELQGEAVFENMGFAVFKDVDGKFIRRFHDSQKGYQIYALMKADIEKRKIFVDYISGAECYFGNSKKDFFHIGWEKILIHENRMILHSACVNTSLGGILFSGPSGIGKSTQAGLWCKYKQAKQINGDRPILRKTESGWKAYGSPYAGSSRCHVNEDCRIRAIVVLKKADCCSLRKIRTIEAFRKIYEQIIVNSWDREYVSKVCDLAMELVTEVPIYELTCTPDKKAVEILEQELIREEELERK